MPHVAEPPMRGAYLLSLSGALEDLTPLSRARERLAQAGWASEADPDAMAVDRRFAGTDAQRLAALSRALDHRCSVVMATRGGYGLSRLLSQIDWQAVAASQKCFIGLSDFTAFNLALLARTGQASLTGVTAAGRYGVYDPASQALDQFLAAMLPGERMVRFQTNARALTVTGQLWGGNLAMVASLVGTPYLPMVEGGILFLEDVGEHPYRVERMLAQLWHSGVLARQRAILLGRFTEYTLASHDRGYGLPDVVAWLGMVTGLPVIEGLPYGHVPDCVMLPVGREGHLSVANGQASLRWSSVLPPVAR